MVSAPKWSAFLLILALGACGTETNEQLPSFDPSADSEEGGDAYDPFVAGKGDAPDGFKQDIEFGSACETGDEFVIASVGDVLLHGRLQQQGFASGFDSLWSGVTDLLEQADITYANLEGPTAPGTNAYGKDVTDPGRRFDNVVYTSYPMFNYHPALLDALKTSGVDVVSTANNHSIDRRELGADRTLDELDARNIPYTGTRRAASDSEEWWTVVEKNGWKVAFLGCTYATNGITDRKNQVLLCFEEADKIEGMVTELSGRSDIDAVIVTPHWGAEYTANPSNDQFKLAHRFLEAGATAILGNHPHVIQPWERYVTRDGRETFVMYSHGNFVSGQRQLERRTTLLLYLGLVRTAEGVKVRGARYIPLHMTETSTGQLTLQAVDRAGSFGDSRQHVTKLMGGKYLLMPHEPVVTNPQCDPSWVPHHSQDGWTGGSCESDIACGETTTCDTELPGGLCTMECTGGCPDAAGRQTTFCVNLGGSGSCVLQCVEDAECRPGYSCVVEPRFNEPGVSRKVCLPTPN
jgi:hypothetical protein